MDQYANFAVSAVATAPSPASSGTSVIVTAGHGARFPAPPFNASVWPIGALPDPLNAEIVRVTARSTDTLTITRAQESTTARSIIPGDMIAATVTKRTLDSVFQLAISLGGSRAASLPLAAATNDLVNAEPAFTVPTLSAEVLATARIIADCRSLDASVNITPRLVNASTIAVAGTGAACTATADDYSGTNQHQNIPVTIVSGQTYKAQAIVAGSGAATYATFCTVRLEIG